eukprot:1464716-Prymnesium_polylepis.1
MDCTLVSERPKTLDTSRPTWHTPQTQTASRRTVTRSPCSGWCASFVPGQLQALARAIPDLAAPFRGQLVEVLGGMIEQAEW